MPTTSGSEKAECPPEKGTFSFFAALVRGTGHAAVWRKSRMSLCERESLIKIENLAAISCDRGAQSRFFDLVIHEAHRAVAHGDPESVHRDFAQLGQGLLGVVLEFIGLAPRHAFGGFDHDNGVGSAIQK